MRLTVTDADSKTKSNTDAETVQPDSGPQLREPEIAGAMAPGMDFSLRRFREEAEIRAIHYALQLAGWNRRRAAKLLNISRRSLLYKIRRHNITSTGGRTQ